MQHDVRGDDAGHQLVESPPRSLTPAVARPAGWSIYEYFHGDKQSFAALLFGFYLACAVSHAQDLAPRAYLITPIHLNAVTLTFSAFNSSILFDRAIPITDASGNPKLEILAPGPMGR